MSDYKELDDFFVEIVLQILKPATIPYALRNRNHLSPLPNLRLIPVLLSFKEADIITGGS